MAKKRQKIVELKIERPEERMKLSCSSSDSKWIVGVISTRIVSRTSWPRP